LSSKGHCSDSFTIGVGFEIKPNGIGIDEEHDEAVPQHNALIGLGVVPMNLESESDADEGSRSLNDIVCSVNVGAGDSIEFKDDGPMIFECKGKPQNYRHDVPPNANQD
jgi:hypothetical protein